MDQQPWFHAGTSGWPTIPRDDTVSPDMDTITYSMPPLSFDLNCLGIPFDASSLPVTFNGHTFAPLEGPNMGFFDFELTALGPLTHFSPINNPQTDLSSPQSGTLVDNPREQFSFNTPPSIGNCTSLAASPLTSLSPWSETPDTLPTWSPSNLMADHMLLQPDLYCALSDPFPLGALGQENQPASFQTPSPVFLPQSFGNLNQREEELDQNLEAPILGRKTRQKLTKAGKEPMRDQRRKERPKKCPFPQCKFFTKGFPYSSEVNKHIRAKHKSEIENLSTSQKTRFNLVKNPPKEYCCPEEGCLKGYGRHDHLLRHRTDKHGRLKQKRGRQARR